MDLKQLSRVEVKDADKGTIAAVFSTLNAIDDDGDVTVKGAFTDGAPVAISAYGHQSWKGKLPVGKGRIRELKSEAVLEGGFFLDTADGRDTFTTVKHMSEDDGPGQEWSYSLRDVKSEMGDFNGQRVRFLKSITVHEVSPVLVGAGVSTRTISAKSLKQPNSEIASALRDLGRSEYGDEDVYVWVEDYDLDDSWVVFSVSADGEPERLLRIGVNRSGDVWNLTGEPADVERTVAYAPKSGNKFSEHGKSVLADLDAFITRACEVVALRAEKGKGIAPESSDLLASVEAELKRLAVVLTPAATPPDFRDEVARQRVRYFAALAQGATTP